MAFDSTVAFLVMNVYIGLIYEAVRFIFFSVSNANSCSHCTL